MYIIFVNIYHNSKTFTVHNFCHTTDETAERQQQICQPCTKCHRKRAVVGGLQLQTYDNTFISIWPVVILHKVGGVFTSGLTLMTFNDELRKYACGYFGR